MAFLDFCGCKYLSDDSVIALTQNYPNLTYLNLVTWFDLFNLDLVHCINR